MESAAPKAVTDLEALAVEVVAVCKQRGWSPHWTERGAYLHLESSELVEAVRGKRGDPVAEAADVLFVLLSIVQPKGITFAEIIAALQGKVAKLKTVPRYTGEQFTENQVTMAENNASARRAAEELERENWLLSDVTPEEREKIVAVISRHVSSNGEVMNHLYTDASVVVDKLSKDLSALQAEVKLMRPVVDAAIAYTVEFATGMTDNALQQLSIAVNTYRAANNHAAAPADNDAESED